MTGDRVDQACVLGPFQVSTASAELEAFARATALGGAAQNAVGGPAVPLSFLPTWLGLATVKPALLDAMSALLGGDDGSLVHMHQDVTVHVPLQPNRSYSLDLSCRQESSDTVVVDGRINDQNEQLVAVMQTKLLVARSRPAA